MTTSLKASAGRLWRISLAGSFAFALALFGRGAEPGDLERLWVADMNGGPWSVKINGVAVAVAIDTGSPVPLIFTDACIRRLGIGLSAPLPDRPVKPGEALGGWSEPFEMDFLGRPEPKRPWPVVKVPSDTISRRDAFDGVLGWPGISEKIFCFDLANRRFGPFDDVPDPVKSMVRFTVLKRDTLVLELPANPDGIRYLAVDTGASDGILLPPDLWKAWRANHPSAPMTLTLKSMFGDLLQSREECWADSYAIGPLPLHDVPIGEAGPAYAIQLASKNFIAIGLAALARMVLVVDGKNQVAYAAGISDPPLPYPHNRLGVTFVPGAALATNPVARVAAGTPAAEAGIQDGDALLQVGATPVTNMRQYIDLEFPNESPDGSVSAGTKVDFTLRRGSATIHVTVTARDILAPRAGDASPAASTATAPPKPG